MRTKSFLTVFQHFVVIFVAIKTALFVDKVDNVFGSALNNKSFYISETPEN